MGNVSVNDLERGMIIDADVFSKKGALLLYKGFKIENADLVSIVLHRNGIQSVMIKDEGGDLSPAVKESDRIFLKIKEEVTAFKDEFSKIVETLEKDVVAFSKTKDLSKIRDLNKSSQLAKESEKSILTIFQLVEKIKNDGTDQYADITQISLISYAIGKWFDLDDAQLRDLCQVALLSGVFRLSGISKENAHELTGTDTLNPSIVESALASRERIDGSGPLGLKEDKIPFYSKIIAVADVFYSLTTPNEFHERISVFDALKIMHTEYFTLLDTKTLYIFLHKVANKYIGSSVRLSDGTTGVIVYVPENQVVSPFIKTQDGLVINLQNEEYKNNKIIEVI